MLATFMSSSVKNKGGGICIYTLFLPIFDVHRVAADKRNSTHSFNQALQRLF